MPRFLIAAVLLLAVSCAIFTTSHAADDNGDVVILNPDNFNEFINRELALVEFFAPWCGHCKQLAPEYATASTDLLHNDPPIYLGSVDATVHGALAGQYDVRGYPTLKIFRHGKAYDYNGPRKADGIISYMKKQVGPAAKPVSSQADIDKLRKSQDVDFTVIGLFNGAKSSQLQSSFNLVANGMRDDFGWGVAKDASALAKDLGITGEEGIVAFRGDEKFVYDGNSKQKSLEEWIRQTSLPLVGEYTEKNAALYQKRNLPVGKLYLKVDRKPNSQTMRYYITRLKKIAEKVQDKVLIAFAHKDDFKWQVDTLGLQEEEHGFAIEDNSAQKMYKLEDEAAPGKKGKAFNVKGIEKLIQDFIKGKAPVHVKSEKAPADNLSRPVKIVTGRNFEELIEDADDKDILLEFYAPWCGHCKSLEPKYEELGKKLKKNKNVIIAKIDATANDYDRQKYRVEGYPTIMFRKAGSSNWDKYEGPREVSDMLSYIKKNGRKAKQSKKAKKSKKRKVEEDEDDE